MSSTPDYYKILQVDPTAEPEVIDAAYRRLAGKYHPDHNKKPDANERMRDLNLAREVLMDPIRRAQYDRQRAADSEQARARDRAAEEQAERSRAEAEQRRREAAERAEAAARAEAERQRREAQERAEAEQRAVYLARQARLRRLVRLTLSLLMVVVALVVARGLWTPSRHLEPIVAGDIVPAGAVVSAQATITPTLEATPTGTATAVPTATPQPTSTRAKTSTPWPTSTPAPPRFPLAACIVNTGSEGMSLRDEPDFDAFAMIYSMSDLLSGRRGYPAVIRNGARIKVLSDDGSWALIQARQGDIYKVFSGSPDDFVTWAPYFIPSENWSSRCP